MESREAPAAATALPHVLDGLPGRLRARAQ